MMSVHINNLESTVTVSGGAGGTGNIDDNQVERIVQIVLERLAEEQERSGRINRETEINNGVAPKDVFD